MDSTKKPQKENPRAKANPISQLFFIWILPLLYKGCRRGLSSDDLYKCLEKDHSEMLGDKLEREWTEEQSDAAKKHRSPKLRRALFRTFMADTITDGLLTLVFVLIKSFTPFVLAQLLIQFQQPLSVLESTRANNSIYNDLFNYTTISSEVLLNSNASADNDVILTDPVTTMNPGPLSSDPIAEAFPTLTRMWNDVYWLSGGMILMIVVGLLVVHHVDLRLRLVGARMRIALCSMMYRKTLLLSKRAAGHTPAGYVVNLMSNDVGRLDYGFIYANYIWILPIQSVLIGYLLWREVGWAAIVGVTALLLKTIPVQTKLSQLSSMLRSKVATRTDKRVGIMNELIRGIQVIKMYAWEKPFEAVVAEARRKEVKQIRYASYIRGIYLSTMVFTERSTLFVAITACILLSQPIRADLVFSMAQYFNILQLTAAILYPLALSLGAEALVSIKRIEEYLMLDEQVENGDKLKRSEEPNDVAVRISNLSASWCLDDKEKTLNNLDLVVPSGKLCAIIGSVGAGKSSLLQLLLGEIPIYTGTLEINGTLSYGSQEPWLFPGTVRSNILFGLEYNRKLYQGVVSHCALQTDFVQLPDGDKTIVGERGTSLSGGQKARIGLARSVYKSASLYLFDDPLSAVDAHVGRHLFEEVIGPNGYLAGLGRTRILVTHQVHFLKEADWIVVLDNGRISYQGTYKELSETKDLDFEKVLEDPSEVDVARSLDDIILESGISENEDEDAEVPFIDGYVKVRSPTLSHRSISQSNVSSEMEVSKQADAEEQAQGHISMRVWKKYLSAGGSVLFLSFFLFILLSSQVIISGSDYFVNYWTQQEFLRSINAYTTLTTRHCLIIYGCFIIAVVFMTVLRGWMFFNLCMRASKNLHNRMFASILRASMRFFDTNPSGRILNRFSRDMGSIDELLPRVIMDSIQIFLVMSGILAMVSIVNPMMILTLLVAIFLFTMVLKLYLRAAQDLKRLDGICRSPVFSHMSASLSGLSTIRVNNAQSRIKMEFDQLQDVQSAVWQLSMSSNNALGLWLDCISALFVAAVTFSFITMRDHTFSGNVGLAISQSLILTGMVQHGVRMSAEALQQMTSVERILQYTDLEPERNPKTKPNIEWPLKGKIQFVDMSLRYDTNEPPVLKHLCLEINAGWKVGIVGRTGAGKSSLISALFRLSPIEGKILIDDLDTAQISLQDLRSNISIIPQDPVLFSATLRYNLDPFNSFDDDSLYRVLEDVELKSSTQGLDFEVTEGGSNYSVGQRQLICLARAILRNTKILVLDEATANVDPRTDSLIQRTIRDKFKHCTVLTVAHRLHTVMDSDRILVMDAGSAKEFDIPHKLLQDPNGILRGIVEATGPQEAESLKRLAENTYKDMSDDKA